MKIVVFKDKHSDVIYDASTPEALTKACLTVLRERYTSGYWYNKPEVPRGFTKEEQEIVDLTEEAISTLPAGLQAGFKEKQTRILRDAEQRKRYYDREIRWFNDAERLLALPVEEAIVEVEPTGRYRHNLAFVLLDERRDGEYEGFEIETVNEATGE